MEPVVVNVDVDNSCEHCASGGKVHPICNRCGIRVGKGHTFDYLVNGACSDCLLTGEERVKQGIPLDDISEPAMRYILTGEPINQSAERNCKIVDDYNYGLSVAQLIHKYSLGKRSIQRIIYEANS